MDGYQYQWGNHRNLNRLHCTGSAVDEDDGILSMQQDIPEFKAFLEILLDTLPEGGRQVAVETGMGDGASHLVWKLLFYNVITVELKPAPARRLLAGMHDVGGSWVVCGDALDPAVSETVKEMVKQVDFLFIDDGHTREQLEADFRNYEPMVRSGGLIAIHDTKDYPDVTGFLDLMWSGEHEMSERVRGCPRNIVQPEHFGITWYQKP